MTKTGSNLFQSKGKTTSERPSSATQKAERKTIKLKPIPLDLDTTDLEREPANYQSTPMNFLTANRVSMGDDWQNETKS